MSNYNQSIAGCQCEQKEQVNLLWNFYSVHICSVSQCCVFSPLKKDQNQELWFHFKPCLQKVVSSAGSRTEPESSNTSSHRLFSFAATVSLLCNLQTWTRSSCPAASLFERWTKQTFPGEKCAADVKFVGPQYVIYNTGSSLLLVLSLPVVNQTQTLKAKGIQPYWHNIKKT